jgi:hypothetical protein
MNCLRCGQSKEMHCRADGATPGGLCAAFVAEWPRDMLPVVEAPQPVPLTVPEKG